MEMPDITEYGYAGRQGLSTLKLGMAFSHLRQPEESQVKILLNGQGLGHDKAEELTGTYFIRDDT